MNDNSPARVACATCDASIDPLQPAWWIDTLRGAVERATLFCGRSCWNTYRVALDLPKVELDGQESLL